MLSVARSTRLLRTNTNFYSLHKCISKNPSRNQLRFCQDKNKFSSTTKPPQKSNIKNEMEALKSDIADIGEILNSSAKREELEKLKPWGTFLKNMIKKSKTELFNIATSFVCLVLAFQVTSQQFISRKLRLENESMVEERDKLLDIVNVLKSEDFLKRVVERCLHVIQERQVANNTSRSWFGFGKSNPSSSVTEEEIILRSILYEEITKVSDENVLSLHSDDDTALINSMLEMLQSEGGGSLEDDSSSVSKSEDDALIEDIKIEDGTKVHRTRKYMM